MAKQDNWRLLRIEESKRLENNLKLFFGSDNFIGILKCDTGEYAVIIKGETKPISYAIWFTFDITNYVTGFIARDSNVYDILDRYLIDESLYDDLLDRNLEMEKDNEVEEILELLSLRDLRISFDEDRDMFVLVDKQDETDVTDLADTMTESIEIIKKYYSETLS